MEPIKTKVVLSAIGCIGLYLLGVVMLFVCMVLVVCSRVKLWLLALFLRPCGRPLDIVSGFDAFFQFFGPAWFADPVCTSTINGMLLFRGKADFAKFSGLLQDRVIDARDPSTGARVMARFTQRMVRRYGYYVWENEPDFSILQHVHWSAEGYVDEASLLKLTADAADEPWDPRRSPWSFTIIPKIARSGSTGQEADAYAVWFRICHSLCDGMGMLRLFSLMIDENCTRKYADITKTFHLNPESAVPLTRYNPLLSYFAKRDRHLNLATLWAIAMNVAKIIFWTPWYLMEHYLHRDRNALHGPRLSGRKLFAVSESVDLQLLRDIAASYQCKLSDVFYCSVAESFRKCDPTVSRMRLLTTLSLLKPGNSLSENTVTYNLIDLPFESENAGRRLQRFCKIIKEEDMTPSPLITYFGTNIFANHLPLPLAQNMLSTTSSSAMATILVASSFELVFLDVNDPVDDVFFFPINGMKTGVCLSMLTYKGKCRIGVTVDRAVALDDQIAHKLADGVVEHFKTLLAGAAKSL